MKKTFTKKSLEEYFKTIKKLSIDVRPDGTYNMLNLLKAPFSETYKDILRRSHSEEWIERFEKMIEERNG